MSTNGNSKRKQESKKSGPPGQRKAPTGRHVRFSDDAIRWIETYAVEHGFNSDADLIRQAVREYRQRIEQESAA